MACKQADKKICGTAGFPCCVVWVEYMRFATEVLEESSAEVCVCVFYISSFPRFFKFAFQICVMIILECCERQLNNILV